MTDDRRKQLLDWLADATLYVFKSYVDTLVNEGVKPDVAAKEAAFLFCTFAGYTTEHSQLDVQHAVGSLLAGAEDTANAMATRKKAAN